MIGQSNWMSVRSSLQTRVNPLNVPRSSLRLRPVAVARSLREISTSGCSARMSRTLTMRRDSVADH